MSDRRNRLTGQLAAPETEADRTDIQQLREDRVVIPFTVGDAYVTAPATTESDVHAFPMLTHEGESWERTSHDG